MGYRTPDVYHQPEKFDLKPLGDISWDSEPYQFDYTVVWQDTQTGALFYASDSGCSCPSPFEDYTSRDKLTPLDDFQAFHEEMKARENTILRNAEEYEIPGSDRLPGDVAEMLQKVKVAIAAR